MTICTIFVCWKFPHFHSQNIDTVRSSAESKNSQVHIRRYYRPGPIALSNGPESDWLIPSANSHLYHAGHESCSQIEVHRHGRSLPSTHCCMPSTQFSVDTDIRNKLGVTRVTTHNETIARTRFDTHESQTIVRSEADVHHTISFVF